MCVCFFGFVCCTLQGISAGLIFNITSIVTRFPKIQIIEMRKITVPMPVWSRHHQKRKLNDCYFNDRWKDTYSWIRELNNQNRAYYKICKKELEIGRRGSWESYYKQRVVPVGLHDQCRSWEFPPTWFEIRFLFMNFYTRFGPYLLTPWFFHCYMVFH